MHEALEWAGKSSAQGRTVAASQVVGEAIGPLGGGAAVRGSGSFKQRERETSTPASRRA